jgi:hypothetical protein
LGEVDDGLLLFGWELLHDQEHLLGRCHEQDSTSGIRKSRDESGAGFSFVTSPKLKRASRKRELSELSRQHPTICAVRANRLPGWMSLTRE